jgi:hypothetical protein
MRLVHDEKGNTGPRMSNAEGVTHTLRMAISAGSDWFAEASKKPSKLSADRVVIQLCTMIVKTLANRGSWALG